MSSSRWFGTIRLGAALLGTFMTVALATSFGTTSHAGAQVPANGYLEAVTCTGASNCWAVGDYENNAKTVVPLAERWDGAGWKVVPVPSPAGGGDLVSVACASSSNCQAVGFHGEGREAPRRGLGRGRMDDRGDTGPGGRG